MLRYHHYIWDSFTRNPDGLYILGRGLDSFEIVRQMVIDSASRRHRLIVFGATDHEKHRIIWDAANANIEFLPKDIEKDTGKKERTQFYEANLVLFHNPGILAKDFLIQMIDPKTIVGVVVLICETVHKDPGLQLALALYRSGNAKGYIRAFSEKVYEMSDLKRSADALCVRFVLLFPRFEQNVSESILPCEIQIIEISLHTGTPDSDATIGDRPAPFNPEVGQNLTRTFDLLSALHSAFIREYGHELKLNEEQSLVFHRKAVEARAVTEEQVKVLESLLFIRRAFDLMLHQDPMVFLQFLLAHQPGAGNLPLWCSFPQVSPLYRSAAAFAEEVVPAPKLQWILHLVSELPKDKRILILAEGSATVGLICGFLAGHCPRTDSGGIAIPLEADGADPELLIDPTVFGVIEPPLVLLQELHAQADVLERFQPDFVIFWDVTLLALRRLEVFNSRYRKAVVSYLLCYEEARELGAMRHSAERETELFVKCIQDLQGLSLLPLSPLPDSVRSVIVDEREFRSSLPLALVSAGFRVIPAVLIVGDYVLSDDIVVERKAYSDLIGSLRSGRLLQQIQRMLQHYAQAILLIEFSDIEQFNAVSAKDRPSMAMSKIVTIVRLFPKLRLVWARNNVEAAKTLLSLSEGQSDPNTAKAIALGAGDREASKGELSPLNFLSALRWLTAAQITALQTTVKSLRNLAELRREEIAQIVDLRTAIKLYGFLHGQLRQAVA
jgi:DNA excision repair protein ERCC-4